MVDPTDKAHDLLGRIRTDLLYQPFLEKANTLVLACRARGFEYVATSGLRPYAEQDDLYKIGREVGHGELGHTVTNAKGGYSPHNFAVALDFTRHVGGVYAGKLNPSDKTADYLVLGEEAAKLNLEWGGAWSSFKDNNHVQLPLKAHGIDWQRMRDWYAEGALDVVFKHLDVRGPW